MIAEQKISSSLAQLQKLDLPRQTRRKINRKIVICLAVGQAKAFAKLKKLATKEAAQQIIDDYGHDPSSFLGRIKDKIEDLKDSIKRKYDEASCSCSTGQGCRGHCQLEVQLCKPGPQPTTDGLGSKLWKLVKITASYVDFVRDSILVRMLIVTLGGYLVFFSSDFTLFSNLIILLLLTTMVVPMLVSAILTTIKHPFTIFEFSVWNDYRTNPASWWETFFIRLVVFCLYIFVPANLINNKENAKRRKIQLEVQGKVEYDTQEGKVSNRILEEQEQLEVYLDEVRKAYLIFKRVEAALELVMQMSIQLTMLLLSMTRFPVASGLQSIFGKDFSSFGSSKTLRDTLLFLSVSWSLKTGVMSFLKIHAEQKSGMQSGVAKVVLGLRALLFSVTRIVCVVAFFGPFLGLLDCQAHWKAEEIELNGDLRKNLESSTSYWDRETVDLMYREQDLTNYTLVTTQQGLFIFIGLILLHGVAILILKIKVSNHFKEVGWLNKIGHLVESLHVPDVYKDFDVELKGGEEEGTPEDYKVAYNCVLKETLWMTSLQMVSNLLLLVPLLVTGEKKLKEKIRQILKTSHNFLPSIQREEEALGTGQQHRDVRRGGRGVRAVEHSEPVSSLHRHDYRRVRGPAGGRLPQVVPSLEDPPARGE